MDKTADETCCTAFRETWLSRNCPRIEDFLPDDTSRQTATLIELIRIDIEMRTQAVSMSSVIEAVTDIQILTVDDYVQRFEELDTDSLRAMLEEALAQTVKKASQYTTFYENNTSLSSQSSTVKEASGRYRVVAEHARGGMGTVWRVIDHKLGREIALKQLSASLSERSEVRRRFVSEARITAQLEHPGIVPIYDLGEREASDPSYTMKLVRGETLTKAIERLHKLKPNDPDRILQQTRLVKNFLSMCLTITYAHSRKVVHRDLKPDNILLGEYGEIVILDWGIAKFLGDSDTQTDIQPTVAGQSHSLAVDPNMSDGPLTDATRLGQIIGTPAYMPPEQARGEVVTYANDIYSLGAVLYQILTGHPPFEGSSLKELIRKIVDEPLTHPRILAKDTPPALEAICLRAIQKSPSDRYPSTAALVRDLDCYLADEPVSCYQESLVERSFRWIRRNRTVVAAGLMIFLISATSIIAYLLVAQANQASVFAEERRLQLARATAETSEAIAVQRMHNDDFSSSVSILDRAEKQLENVPELNDLRMALVDKRKRAEDLATYSLLRRKLNHHELTDEAEESHLTALQCIDVLGISSDSARWWEELPTDDLSDAQRSRIREEVRAIFLHLSLDHISMGFVEYAAINKNSSLTVKTNNVIQEKVAKAKWYLSRANEYRESTATEYVLSIAELASGEISFLNWLRKFLTVAPQEPVSAVDCYFMARFYTISQEITVQIPVLVSGAELLGSETRLQDAAQQSERLMLKAIRLQPDYYSALWQVGKTLAISGNYMAAHRCFDSCIRIDPEGAAAYPGRALALLVKSIVVSDPEWKKSLRQLGLEDASIALRLAPRNAQILQDVGSLQTFLGEFNSGVHLSLEGLDLSSQRITGQFSIEKKRYMQNSIQLSEDLGAEPVLVSIFQATVAMDAGQADEAMELVKDVPESHDLYFRVLALRANATYMLGNAKRSFFGPPMKLDPQKALGWADEAISKSPAFYRARRAKTLLLGQLGRYEAAVDAIDGTIDGVQELTTWQRTELLWLKGVSLSQLHRKTEAERAMNEAKSVSQYYSDFVSRKLEDSQ